MYADPDTDSDDVAARVEVGALTIAEALHDLHLIRRMFGDLLDALSRSR